MSIEAGRLHVPPVGALLERKLPASSTATHSVVDWQLTAVTPSVPGEESEWTGAGHANGAAAWAALAAIPAAHSAAVNATSVRRACVRILVLPIVTTPAFATPVTHVGCDRSGEANSRCPPRVDDTAHRCVAKARACKLA